MDASPTYQEPQGSLLDSGINPKSRIALALPLDKPHAEREQAQAGSGETPNSPEIERDYDWTTRSPVASVPQTQLAQQGPNRPKMAVQAASAPLEKGSLFMVPQKIVSLSIFPQEETTRGVRKLRFMQDGQGVQIAQASSLARVQASVDQASSLARVQASVDQASSLARVQASVDQASSLARVQAPGVGVQGSSLARVQASVVGVQALPVDVQAPLVPVQAPGASQCSGARVSPATLESKQPDTPTPLSQEDVEKHLEEMGFGELLTDPQVTKVEFSVNKPMYYLSFAKLTGKYYKYIYHMIRELEPLVDNVFFYFFQIRMETESVDARHLFLGMKRLFLDPTFNVNFLFYKPVLMGIWSEIQWLDGFQEADWTDQEVVDSRTTGETGSLPHLVYADCAIKAMTTSQYFPEYKVELEVTDFEGFPEHSFLEGHVQGKFIQGDKARVMGVKYKPTGDVFLFLVDHKWELPDPSDPAEDPIYAFFEQVESEPFQAPSTSSQSLSAEDAAAIKAAQCGPVRRSARVKKLEAARKAKAAKIQEEIFAKANATVQEKPRVLDLDAIFAMDQDCDQGEVEQRRVDEHMLDIEKQATLEAASPFHMSGRVYTEDKKFMEFDSCFLFKTEDWEFEHTFTDALLLEYMNAKEEVYSEQREIADRKILTGKLHQFTFDVGEDSEASGPHDKMATEVDSFLQMPFLVAQAPPLGNVELPVDNLLLPLASSGLSPSKGGENSTGFFDQAPSLDNLESSSGPSRKKCKLVG